MFFNSLVILMDGWNKHVTGVFHLLNLNKLCLTKTTRELMILAVFFAYTYGQKLSDVPFEICKNERLVGRWLSAQSSLTDNQGKIETIDDPATDDTAAGDDDTSAAEPQSDSTPTDSNDVSTNNQITEGESGETDTAPQSF